MHITANNAYYGLAGSYIVTSAKAEGGCGEPFGLADVPENILMIGDRVLDKQCQLHLDHDGPHKNDVYGDVSPLCLPPALLRRLLAPPLSLPCARSGCGPPGVHSASCRGRCGDCVTACPRVHCKLTHPRVPLPAADQPGEWHPLPQHEQRRAPLAALQVSAKALGPCLLARTDVLAPAGG